VLVITALTMSIIPATFEDINEFIVEQERILTKPIKNDAILQKELRKHKIEIDEDTLDKVLVKLNKEIRRKYRMSLFLRQSRFQVVQQMMQVEREEQMKRMDTLDSVRNVLGVFRDRIGTATETVIDDAFLELIEELPDSNLLETNDVELIDDYDAVRDQVLEKVENVKKLRREAEDIEEINQRLKVQETSHVDKHLQEQIANEVNRMRYLLAMIEQNEKIV
jgi:molybdopterin converting factor small subunit